MAKTETGWTKEFPKVEGVYWARRTQNSRPEPTAIQVWQDGDEWFAYRFNDSRDIEAQRFTESLYEYLGPLSPADAEQLSELRQALHSVRRASPEESVRDCCGDRYTRRVAYACSCGAVGCQSCISDHLLDAALNPKPEKETQGK